MVPLLEEAVDPVDDVEGVDGVDGVDGVTVGVAFLVLVMVTVL